MRSVNVLLISISIAVALFQWFGVVSSIAHIHRFGVQAAGVGEAEVPTAVGAVIVVFLLLLSPIITGSTVERVICWLVLFGVVGTVLVNMHLLSTGQLCIKPLDGKHLCLDRQD